MSQSNRNDQQLVEFFDPRNFTPAFYDNPYPTFRALRHVSPVHQCPDGTVFFSRHRDLNRIYRDPKTFSSSKEAQFLPLFGISPLYEHHTTSLVFNDPPLHTHVRKAIGNALSPRVIAAMERQLVSLVERLLDELDAKASFDLMDDFASVIPIEVIGNLLDIEPHDRGPLRDWSNAILGALEFGLDKQRLETGNAAVSDFVSFLRDLINDRRQNLDRDDIVSRLLRWESDGFELTEQQIYHQCIFLLNAGHETTTNLIGNGIHALLSDRSAYRQLRADVTLIKPAVEEFLRFEAPVQLGNRVTTRAVSFDDIHIPTGTTLTLGIGAANRDPEVFQSPEDLDIARKDNPHLAFAGGIHTCAGMAVARLEAQIAIKLLLQRFPGLDFDGEPVRAQRARFRGFTNLPLRA